MEEILVFGHKNPDTDSICSSIAMVNLLNKMEKSAKAVKTGINKETKFALSYFKVEEPKTLERIEDGQKVVMVDHNEFSQSMENIENAKVFMVVDHHRISNFETSEPLYYFAKPVGCTATVLYGLYKTNNIEIEREIAGLMLSAIISDTLLFKSPTCTQEDIEVAKELERIAEMDMKEYGLEMLKAGTDLSDFSEKELIDLDAKKSEKNGSKIVIAQVNTVSIEDVLERKDALENAINKEIEENDLDLFVFAITDILNSNSEILVLGKKAEVVEKAFGNKIENNTMFLEGVVSRKKQILPPIDQNL